MKFLLSLSLFALLQCNIFVNCNDLEEAVEIIINSEPICDQNKTIQCGRSCGEYYVCRRGSTTPLSVNRCPLDRPFCNFGTHVDSCHTARDLSRFTCQPLPFLFQCTDAGYFPDPTDCAAYYVCEEFWGGFNPTRKTCREGLVYNARQRRCSAPSTNNPCHTISCANGTSKFEAFPGNTGFFYNCVERSVNVPSGKIPVMYRCPPVGSSTSSSMWNSTSNRCEYTCRSSRVWIGDSAREFYQCGNTNEQALLQRCPPEFEFNNSNQQCVLT